MVHGAWHRPSVYSEVAASLETHGYPTVSVALPSAGATPPHKDFNGDVAAIRDCITELVLDKKEVVLVVHSYGGFPGGEAPKGLGKKQREANGLKGGVIRYVVINGIAMPEGYQPHAMGDYSEMPSWIDLDIEVPPSPNYFEIIDTHLQNGTSFIPLDVAKRVFYHDVPSAKADELSAQLVPQSLGVFFSTSTYAAWKDIPSTFLSSDDDRTPFSAEMKDMMIKLAQESVPSAFDVVEHCKDAGHCVMASYPEVSYRGIKFFVSRSEKFSVSGECCLTSPETFLTIADSPITQWTADALRRAAGEKF
jgi:pimeloyl-ACP methyl ester carboxylesterase